MEECNHIFIGKADGVHCTRCGAHFSADEYSAMQKTKNAGTEQAAEEQNVVIKEKRQTKRKVKTNE